MTTYSFQICTLEAYQTISSAKRLSISYRIVKLNSIKIQMQRYLGQFQMLQSASHCSFKYFAFKHRTEWSNDAFWQSSRRLHFRR